VDLPTYTSIWRIEKRLYKLYDFRLPMPVPVGQIAVFAAITLPYVILLTILGLPFNHTLFWLYVLPPGVITWLATRPVLESKRLPELVISQVRYLGEPGIWCRMAPLAEKDDVVVIGKVWRRDEEQLRSPAAAPALAPASAPAAARRPARVRPAAARTATAQAAAAQPPGRVPRAAPAPRLRTAGERRGRATQWPGVAAGPAGPPPVMAADAPSEIAHDERQLPLRPAAAPAGRHAARPAFPSSTPGLPAAEKGQVTRPPDSDALAAPRRPPAAWPAKDPHAPASTASTAPPAGPAWTRPVPPAPAHPVSGDWAMTAGPLVPAAADPIPPVPADPDPAGPEFPMGRADAPAAPDTARPASPAGPAVSVPAQAASPEPLTGMPTGPAGFFIGPLQPEIADSGDAVPGAAQDEKAEHRTAAPEEPDPEVAGDGAAEPPVAEGGTAEPAVAEPEMAEPAVAEGETAETETAAADAAGDETAKPAAAETMEAGDGTAEPAVAEPAVAEPGMVGAEVAEAAAVTGRARDETAEPEVAGLALSEPALTGPELDAPDALPDETAGPVLAPPAAQTSAPEALPEDAALVQPGFPPEPHALGGAREQGGTESPAAPDGGLHDARLPGEDRPDEDRPDEDRPDEDRPDEDRPDEDRPDKDRPDEDLPGEAAAPAAGAPPSPASPWVPPVVVVRGASSVRPTLVERALSGPSQHRAGSSWREHVRVVPGGHGPGRPDMERRDRARVLLPIHGPRLIVVLGCTVGAGQTVTTLMLADVLASLRGEPVAALDLNPGQTSLTDMARTSPTGTARGLLAGAPPTVPGQGGRGGLDLIAHDSVPDGGPALADEEYARVLEILTSRYPLTLTDPGASAVARVLSTADQLILVAPASSDAARAVATTMEWLDGHGYGELCNEAITVINGVSKRSMSHVEQAELVVHGRSRAIVRVPWDDHLGAPPTEQGITGADTDSRFAQLRPPLQLAYTALAGVLVSALAVGVSRSAPPGGPVPPDTAPQRWAAR
jgi:MinD-like ATPase involved in chromosome partitioning or flagellar assembly